MAKNKSINGWEVIESYTDPRLDSKVIPGTNAMIKMRKEVLPLFLALAADYHREVAKIRKTETGAFNPRKSAFSNSWSDHASGTAIDINWGHEGAVGPNGGMKTMSRAQIRACAIIKQRYEIVIWGGDKARGGDYVNPKYWDPMHFALKPGTTMRDVKRVIEEMGIKPNGKREGVKYGILDVVKASVATEVLAEKPVEQKIKKAPAKKAVASVRSYTVKPGDTLSGIASKFGSTVAAIKKENGLTSSLIKPSQKLRVPKK